MSTNEYDRPPRMYMVAKYDPIGAFLRPWKKFTKGKVCSTLAKGPNARSDLLELMYEYIDQSVLIEIYPLLPNEPSIHDVERVLIEHFEAASYLFGPGFTVDIHAKQTDMSAPTERAAWRRAVMMTELAEFAVGRNFYTTETELNPQGRSKKALQNAPMKFSKLDTTSSGLTPQQVYEANQAIHQQSETASAKHVRPRV
ncbi:hypothetical protein SARC_09069 [Sphaeroforma arctica JP610]|uniref:Uncharacterized protein n=1 Tax=Sphaeroforma arctica JP610 TaxID=667725 RepID=A0A0L0FPS2_9EUKA|nr:hypothetical protein SARC_09069 [Sphaeroforma arctica JP610]KNC78511.1 hypothetical protein SARC_09069 [Sphaeroforma arctica JP610]|eukprot:XP_014152413.1 hypothetical protein SARC_09069 [Sphaeroforma arctica JP610]